MTKPSVDMIMKRKVNGHSPAHLKSELAKKEAAKKGADLKRLPKEDLGPLLDQFRQYLKGAGEVALYYPTLDDRRGASSVAVLKSRRHATTSWWTLTRNNAPTRSPRSS